MKTIINAEQPFSWKSLGEIWEYRELLWMLAWRDFKVKYSQTFLGIAWAILNPVLNLVILAFIFGKVAQVDTQGTPFLLFTAAGLLGWTYFSEVFSTAGNSILAAQNMIKKIYFPRLVIPLSKAITALIDFFIVLVLLVVLMVYYKISLSSSFLFFPFFLLIALVAGLTGGIWLSALTIRYRDFHHISPFILRMGFFASPIAYPASSIPASYQFVYNLNPLVAVIEGLRWSIIGGTPPTVNQFISIGFTVVFLFLGIYYFKKVEISLADIL